MSTWIKNFLTAMESKEVIILHDNVRDKYVFYDKETGISKTQLFSDLTQVIEGLHSLNPRQPKIKWLHDLYPNLPKFDTVCFYDASGKYRETNRRKEEAIKPDRVDENAYSGPALGRQPGNQLADVNGQEPTSAQKGSNTKQPLIALGNWVDELSDPSANMLAVLFYLDKIQPYQSSYSSDEMRLIVTLEKIIHNIAPENRLIMVALRDSMLPEELYMFSPKVRLIPIPLPSQADREHFLRQYLYQEEVERESLPLDLITNMTEGLYLHDLEPIIKEIKKLPARNSESDVRRCINKYRLGEQEDYWERLKIRRLISMTKIFEGDNKGGEENRYGIKGQSHAIDIIADALAVAKAGLVGLSSNVGSARPPRAILFFAGPSGVGKTFVAKSLADFLFGSEDSFIRFDMSEFQHDHSVAKFIGSPPGYVGHEQGGQLTAAVKSKPFSVILFDEIEKAHPKIMDIFLQILDDGRLTDSRGQTIFFTEAIIVFTSNIGTRTQSSGQHPTSIADIEREPLDKLKGIRLKLKQQLAESPDNPTLKEELEKNLEEIRNHFKSCVQRYFREEISRPELLNRLGDRIIPFDLIDDPETQKQIAASVLGGYERKFEDMYRKYSWKLKIDHGIIEPLQNKYKERIAEGGGRQVRQILEDEISPRLAYEVLEKIELGVSRPLTFYVTFDRYKRVDVSVRQS